jgi:hypothetical protein
MAVITTTPSGSVFECARCKELCLSEYSSIERKRDVTKRKSVNQKLSKVCNLSYEEYVKHLTENCPFSNHAIQRTIKQESIKIHETVNLHLNNDARDLSAYYGLDPQFARRKYCIDRGYVKPSRPRINKKFSRDN